MVMFDENTGLMWILFSFIVFGLGNGLFFPSNTKSVISSVDKKYLGVASAVLSNIRGMGQVFGMGIVLLVISKFLGILILQLLIMHHCL